MYFNVKIIIKLLNGMVVKLRHAVMTEREMDKIVCWDVWNDGKTKSVTVYTEGRFLCNWHISRGEQTAV